MAISEICQFEVKEEIDQMQNNEGISRNEASKRLAKFFSDNLNQEYKSETIRKKDQRARKKLGTNVPTSKPTFNKSDIEWTDYTWNPITGCKHGCKYCYGRDIAKRFKDKFPKGWEPHFREERLTAPENTPLPKNGNNKVFVCSMADMWGDWVPTEWIEKVLDACKNSPQWAYIFLTKNPKRYAEFSPFPDNFWIGATVDTQKRVKSTEIAFLGVEAKVKFVSCEPLLEAITFKNMDIFDWMIVGAQTGKKPFQPDRKWVFSLMDQAREANCKIYLKPNLIAGVREMPMSNS